MKSTLKKSAVSWEALIRFQQTSLNFQRFIKHPFLFQSTYMAKFTKMNVTHTCCQCVRVNHVLIVLRIANCSPRTPQSQSQLILPCICQHFKISVKMLVISSASYSAGRSCTWLALTTDLTKQDVYCVKVQYPQSATAVLMFHVLDGYAVWRLSIRRAWYVDNFRIGVISTNNHRHFLIFQTNIPDSRMNSNTKDKWKTFPRCQTN